MKKDILYRGMSFYKGTLDNFLSDLYSYINTSFDSPNIVVTPNPEMIVEMNKNERFSKIMQYVKYRLVDGFGLWFFLKYLWREKFVHRICGSDLLSEILKRNGNDDFKIYLLGASEGVAAKIAEMYPNSNVVGFDAPVYTEDEALNDVICQKVVNSEADLLFVAFGAPKQEYWMWENKDKLDCVKFMFGVGGAFDYVAGEVSRAPAVMRKYVGLEWLFRLIKNPLLRGKRIWNAVVVFPFIFMNDLYKKYFN